MKDYIEQAVKTESLNWFEPDRRLMHAAMGLVTEVAELRAFTDEKNIVEELGDIMWYVALACSTLQITLHEAEEAAGVMGDDPIEDMIISAGEVIDVLKKSTFYAPEKYNPRKIMEHLGRIILCVAEVGDQRAEVFLDEIMVANIEKLRKRYKSGKFSQDDALHRDVEIELNHI